VRTVEADKPPLHPVLGRPGYDMITAKIADCTADIEAWKETTFSADIPST